jgi:uncharacterized membrane protein YphA (DoxX/SURF4 family)
MLITGNLSRFRFRATIQNAEGASQKQHPEFTPRNDTHLFLLLRHVGCKVHEMQYGIAKHLCSSRFVPLEIDLSQSAVNKLIVILRILLGSVFVFGGIAKLFSPHQAADLLSWMLSLNTQTSKVLVVLASTGEIVIGVAMMIGREYLLVAAILSSAILLIFIIVGLVALQSPRPCGCFGEVLESKTDEYFILRNIVLFLISMSILRYSLESSHGKVL